jgi:subtilisin family serine protease
MCSVAVVALLVLALAGSALAGAYKGKKVSTRAGEENLREAPPPEEGIRQHDMVPFRTWGMPKEVPIATFDGTWASNSGGMTPVAGAEARAYVGGDFGREQGVDSRLLDARRGLEDGALSRHTTYCFIRTVGPEERDFLESLEFAGATPLGRHVPGLIKVEIDLYRLDAVSMVPGVVWIGYAPDELKLDPGLAHRMSGAGAGEVLDLHVNVFEDDLGPLTEYRDVHLGDVTVQRVYSHGLFHQRLEELGMEVGEFNPSINAFRAKGTPAQIEAALGEDFVLFIEGMIEPQLHHDESIPLINGDLVRATDDGAGIVVGIMDSGFDHAHWDLPGYICGYDATPEGAYWTDNCGHGSHVAGTILGRGVGDSKYKGVAPGVANSATTRALIAKHFDGTCAWHGAYTDATGFFRVGGCETGPAMVVNNSWGWSSHASAPVGTDAGTRHYDQEVYDNNICYVFSAGNGADRNLDGWIDYYGPGSIGTPAAGKNIMAVGAVEDFGRGTVGEWWEHSSQGPTGDSRMKPNLVAPGHWVRSVLGETSSGYTTKHGTSMAAPHVTGAIATFAEHYAWSHWDPSLMRAWFMACAIPRNDNILQDHNKYGMGRIDQMLAHYGSPTTSGWTGFAYHSEVTEDGDWWYGAFTLENSPERMVLVMTWDEEAASAGAGNAVVWDLDLYLDLEPFSSSGNGGEWYSLSSVDNTEYLIVENPPAGNYRVKTYAYDGPGTHSLHADVAVHAIYGDTDGSPGFWYDVDPQCIQPGEEVTLSATASCTNYASSAVMVELSSLPGGTAVTGLSSTLMDGTALSYNSSNQSERSCGCLDEITLGTTTVGRERSAAWTIRGNTEGTKTVYIRYNTENHVDVTLQETFYVDGTDPVITSLTSESHVPGSCSQNRTMNVCWSASDNLCGIDGYSYGWSINNPATPDCVKDAEGSLDCMNYTVGGPGEFYFNIRPIDNAGNCGATSSIGPFIIGDPPNRPTNIAATDDDCYQVRVTWTDNSDDEDGFYITRSGVPLATVGPNVTHYDDLSVPTCTEYYYCVGAYNDCGDSGCPIGNNGMALTVPDAPSGCNATDDLPTSVIITWHDNSSGVCGETRFTVYRDALEIGSVPADVTSYEDTECEPGVNHSYSVIAFNSCGASGVCGDHGRCGCDFPNPATDLQATKDRCDRIDLRWTDNSSDELGFGIYREGSFIDAVGANTTSYTDWGAVSCVVYEYCVAPYNSCGQAPCSDPDRGAVIAPPAPPINCVASDDLADHVHVTWTDASSSPCVPTGFRIYRDGGEIGMVGAGVTAYDDYGCDLGMVHEYCVKAYNDCGESPKCCDEGGCTGVVEGFIRGDDDGDGELTISDPILGLCAQFSGCSLTCLDASDCDDDGEITISDPIYNLDAQFGGGPRPPMPFPDCGTDPTADALDCVCHRFCMGCGPVISRAEGDVRMWLGQPQMLGQVEIAYPLFLESDKALLGFECTVTYPENAGSVVRFDSEGAAARVHDYVSATDRGVSAGEVRIGDIVSLDLSRTMGPGTHEIGSLVLSFPGGLPAAMPDVQVAAGKYVTAGLALGDATARIVADEAVLGSALAGEFSLHVIPNPTAGHVDINYCLPVSGAVEVAVYNSAGQKVREVVSSSKQAGPHMVSWDCRNAVGEEVPGGVYFCRVDIAGDSRMVKLVVLR